MVNDVPVLVSVLLYIAVPVPFPVPVPIPVPILNSGFLLFQTPIGNWFQCFPVYPDLNLSSGSGSGSGSVSGSGSRFRIPAFPYAPCARAPSAHAHPGLARTKKSPGFLAYLKRGLGFILKIFLKKQRWLRQ